MLGTLQVFLKKILAKSLPMTTPTSFLLSWDRHHNKDQLVVPTVPAAFKTGVAIVVLRHAMDQAIVVYRSLKNQE
jgi:hypothetical protein